MSSRRPRILIAEDHKLVAELYRDLLDAEFDVIGIVGDGCAMIRAASNLKPELIVVDIAMPILDGLEAARRVKKLLPLTRLVFVTMILDETIAAEVFRCGGSAYLTKTCAASELLVAVRKVLKGGSYLTRTLSEHRIDYLRRMEGRFVAIDQRLTPRQVEVLRLLAEGKQMKQNAAVLNLTTRTVAFYKYRMMESLGARSGADLVRYAVKNGHVSASE